MTKIALAQLSPKYLDKKATIDLACEKIAEAGQHGADLILFPEAFISGYPDWVWTVPNSHGAELSPLYARLVTNAMTLHPNDVQPLCSSAQEADIIAAIGMNERNEEASDSSVFNSMLFIDNTGEILGKHRKLIPTGGERLIWAQGDGSTLKTYDTRVGTIGGLICWENYMPLARQAMYQSGIQILLAPTWDKSANWLQSMQHIAREGGIYVLSCCPAMHRDDIPDNFEFKNRYPAEREWINSGNSCVIGPDGKFRHEPVANEQRLIYADIEVDDILGAKRMFDVAGHYSRPDVFTFDVKTL